MSDKKILLKNKKTGGQFEKTEEEYLNYLSHNEKSLGHNSEKPINSDLREQMNDARIPDLKLSLTDDNQLFSNSLNHAKIENKNGWMVDGHSPDETKDFKKFISKDELAGVAIKPDGDITCVFKSEQSQVRGAIQDLIITARENGGVKMDCYGVRLVKMYEKCGFEPVAKVRFDPQ